MGLSSKYKDFRFAQVHVPVTKPLLSGLVKVICCSRSEEIRFDCRLEEGWAAIVLSACDVRNTTTFGCSWCLVPLDDAVLMSIPSVAPVMDNFLWLTEYIMRPHPG